MSNIRGEKAGWHSICGSKVKKRALLSGIFLTDVPSHYSHAVLSTPSHRLQLQTMVQFERDLSLFGHTCRGSPVGPSRSDLTELLEPCQICWNEQWPSLHPASDELLTY